VTQIKGPKKMLRLLTKKITYFSPRSFSNNCIKVYDPSPQIDLSIALKDSFIFSGAAAKALTRSQCYKTFFVRELRIFVLS
jgi:hypothetical protein